MKKKMAIIFAAILVILSSNFVFAQDKKVEPMLSESQQVMMQENMKMMGDMMIEMSKVMEKGQISPENQKAMCSMMKNMGGMIQTMNSAGCCEKTLKQHKDELSSYQKGLQKMADF